MILLRINSKRKVNPKVKELLKYLEEIFNNYDQPVIVTEESWSYCSKNIEILVPERNKLEILGAINNTVPLQNKTIVKGDVINFTIV